MNALRHPAAWYLGVALGLPVAGGAELDAAFAEHAATVLSVSAAVLGLRWLWRRRPPPRGGASSPEGRPYP